MNGLGRRLVLIVAGVAIATAAAAEPVTTIRSNGSPSNRVDLVIMGDGYTAAEIAAGKFSADVETPVAGIFAQQPYAEYAAYFNVHRIDVVSNQSGDDHPSRGVFVDTALGAVYDCGGITRLICVNGSAVNAVLSRSIARSQRARHRPRAGQRSGVRRLGGRLRVASTHASVVDLVLHETGHSFALLADEYPTPESVSRSSRRPRTRRG